MIGSYVVKVMLGYDFRGLVRSVYCAGGILLWVLRVGGGGYVNV